MHRRCVCVCVPLLLLLLPDLSLSPSAPKKGGIFCRHCCLFCFRDQLLSNRCCKTKGELNEQINKKKKEQKKANRGGKKSRVNVSMHGPCFRFTLLRDCGEKALPLWVWATCPAREQRVPSARQQVCSKDAATGRAFKTGADAHAS